MGWEREFEDPIPLPNGGQLITLRDAGKYIEALPAAEHELEHWKTAIEILLLVVQHRCPRMMARIAVMKALYPGPAGPPEPRRRRAKKYNIIS